MRAERNIEQLSNLKIKTKKEKKKTECNKEKGAGRKMPSCEEEKQNYQTQNLSSA